MTREDAASVLLSAVTTARHLEGQAAGIDDALVRLRRGEVLPPGEVHALLVGHQEAYRRVSGHILLVATLILRDAEAPAPVARAPWWRRWATRWRRWTP